MLKIIIQNTKKQSYVARGDIIAAVRGAAASANITAGEITVRFVDDGEITRLNRVFHNSAVPTDVLAFNIAATAQPRSLTADIAVSYQTACRNAARFRTTPRRELILYVIHGMLHLAGYNDHSLPARKKMRAKEKEILRNFITRP